MKDDRPSGKAWRDLELFRNARAFAGGGCVLAGLIAAAVALASLISS